MACYKLLIADDEENIRNGLKYIIDWEQEGFKLCGEATNGKEAYEQIIDLRPNLVMLDIKMPGMSGIEVVEKINDYCLKNDITPPSFIILSGYSEFDYAKAAVNLGVKFYLLKPVDEDELLKNVRQIKNEIEQTRILKEDSQIAAKMSTKEFILKMFQTGNMNIPENLKRTAFFENEDTSSYCVIIFNLNYYPKEHADELEKSLNNYFSFFTKEILINNNSILVLLKTLNEQAINNCIERAAKLNTERTYICKGDLFSGIEGLLKSYNQALSFEKYLFFISKDNCVDSKLSVIQSNNTTQEFIESTIENLIFYIETYDKPHMEKTLEEINRLFSDVNNNENIIKKNFIYILIELRNRLEKKYPEREITDGNTLDVVPKILDFNTFEEAFSFFKHVLNNFIENFNFNTTESIIVKVIAYIKNNYASDLKLETLGEKFNCNSAYLGKKFKKYTGVQFNTYLDDLRIEIAKDKLINTNLKIYQISKLVGYLNTDYFFMKFKKKTGLTPKEFKNKFNKEGEHED